MQESELWADQDLSFADTDWNFVSINHATPYPGFDGVDVSVNDLGYGMASTFASFSDSGSNEPLGLPVSAHVASSMNSQGETNNTLYPIKDHIPNISIRRVLATLSCVSAP